MPFGRVPTEVRTKRGINITRSANAGGTASSASGRRPARLHELGEAIPAFDRTGLHARGHHPLEVVDGLVGGDARHFRAAAEILEGHRLKHFMVAGDAFEVEG